MIRGSSPPELEQRRHDGAPALEPLSVRISTAVQLTGISRSRLYELIQSGDLAVKKIGRSTIIPFAELKRLVAITSDVDG